MRNASETETETRPAGAAAASAAAAAAGLLGWLDDLLDLARERGDGALARSVAGVMDGLGGAPAGGG